MDVFKDKINVGISMRYDISLEDILHQLKWNYSDEDRVEFAMKLGGGSKKYFKSLAKQIKKIQWDKE